MHDSMWLPPRLTKRLNLPRQEASPARRVIVTIVLRLPILWL